MEPLTDRADDVASWPRERVAAAVALARRMGAVPDGPLPADVGSWPPLVAEVVEAADALVRACPAKYSARKTESAG